MFKMDSKLSTAMEEFQEVVRANGEELHCRLIDTSQMWVSKSQSTQKTNFCSEFPLFDYNVSHKSYVSCPYKSLYFITDEIYVM